MKKLQKSEHLYSTKSVENRRSQIYKNMSPAEKLAVVEDLYFTALALKRAHFRKHHPEWSTNRVEQEAKEWMSTGSVSHGIQ